MKDAFLVGSVLNPKMQSYIAQFLSVYISGSMEEGLRILLIEFAKPGSPDEIHKFTKHNVEGFTTPFANNIKQLLNKFSSDWGSEFSTRIEHSQKASLDSLVVNKNNIAHGRQSLITLVDVEKFYKDCQKIIELIDDIVFKVV